MKKNTKQKKQETFIFEKNLKILFSMCLRVCVRATAHTRRSGFGRQESVHHEVPRYQMRLIKGDVRHVTAQLST